MADALAGNHSYIEGRGKDFCRGCHGRELFSALNLGSVPIANELLINLSGAVEKFPLHLRVCGNCGLGQVGDVTTPERIFRDYRYLSSVSSTFLSHASRYVDDQMNKGWFQSGEWVLEIASNDGYLLKNFLDKGINVVGIEPAENVALISRSLGIQTISEFFSSELALVILQKYGYPKLIIVNNVLAHVPDLRDFILGLSILTDVRTVISIENPSILNILQMNQFDTIYHEHYSYLSATFLNHILIDFKLKLTDIEEIETHGGSNRYWVSSSASKTQVSDSVEEILAKENNAGIKTQSAWTEASLTSIETIESFSNWLEILNSKNAVVYGYGAAAKASTLLNVAGVRKELIKAIADSSQEKQGRFMPGAMIPIIKPLELFSSNATDVIIFPWNLAKELCEKIRAEIPGEINIWRLIPELEKL